MNQLGMAGEIKACEYLQKRRYKLLCSNYKSRFGEIDLVMSRGKYICFIEVKMRSVNSIAAPREFVDESKQQKIVKSALMYLQQYPTELQPRFDVVEVYSKNGEIKSIKHLENAYQVF
ncbi:MAG: YraN family protein [Clostridiales bacterium]|nr:YraN family protein [Clostridiales bacterium]